MEELKTLIGTAGTAARVPVVADHAQISGWVITAPGYHPLWFQYFLGALDLSRSPDPVRHYPEATHEIVVVTLDPSDGPHRAEDVTHDKPLPYLEPVDLVFQMTSTNRDVVKLAAWLARSVIDGVLNPEASGSEEHTRAAWSSAILSVLGPVDGAFDNRLN